jgi:hypothetical protein
VEDMARKTSIYKARNKQEIRSHLKKKGGGGGREIIQQN